MHKIATQTQLQFVELCSEIVDLGGPWNCNFPATSSIHIAEKSPQQHFEGGCVTMSAVMIL